MSKVLDLIFIISLVAFVVFWWKKRKARLAAGETYASDATYQKISGQKRWIGIVCVASFAISVVLNALSDGAEMIDGIKNLFNLVFVATLLAFVYYWRKKASARKAAGDNYQTDESYLRISEIKRMIGGVCIVSLILGMAIPNSPAEEQKQAIERAQNRERAKIDDAKDEAKKFLKNSVETAKKYKQHGANIEGNGDYTYKVEGVQVNGDRYIVNCKLGPKNAMKSGQLILRNNNNKWEIVEKPNFR